MKNMGFLSICFFLFMVNHLHANIESLVINWNPGLCIESCGQLLQQELGRLHDIESSNIDLREGRAILKLKPRAQFSYVQIDQAIRKVGLGIHNWRLVVKGNIRTDGQNIYLISTDDSTRFTLINPVIPNPNQMNIQHSLFNRELDPDLRAELLRIEKARETVRIEGPLFDPWRTPFNYFLIVERIIPNPPKPQ